jgi:DNA-binding response OmpR family regulator
MPYALIVEDDEDIAQIYRMALHEAGYTIDIVYDGRAALDYLVLNVPHLVILDMQLPRVSGPDVLHAIRSNPKFSDIIVIVASANPHMSEETSDLADIVLTKPVGYQQLRDLVKRFK